jgi:hypothetical protein
MQYVSHSFGFTSHLSNRRIGHFVAAAVGADGLPAKGSKGGRDEEPESDKGKVRYIRTLEEGLVREMSYIPKEGGVKQAEVLGQGSGKKAMEKKGAGKEKKVKDY